MLTTTIRRKPKIYYYDWIKSLQYKDKLWETKRLAHNICQRCHIRQGRLGHHNHYLNLGYEVPGVDIIWICWPCHDELHFPANDNQLELPIEDSAYQDEEA